MKRKPEFLDLDRQKHLKSKKGGKVLKKIVVALKFTQASRFALEKAITLAKENGAELHAGQKRPQAPRIKKGN
jgi:hypothetical protein